MKCEDCFYCKYFKKGLHSLIPLVGNCWKHNKIIKFEDDQCQDFDKVQLTERPGMRINQDTKPEEKKPEIKEQPTHPPKEKITFQGIDPKTGGYMYFINGKYSFGVIPEDLETYKLAIKDCEQRRNPIKQNHIKGIDEAIKKLSSSEPLTN